MKINIVYLREKEDVMISLFSWKRASHNSDILGSQQVSDRLGAFPWPPWSSCDYRKGRWDVVWGLNISFSVHLSLISNYSGVCCWLWLTIKVNLIWFGFILLILCSLMIAITVITTERSLASYCSV